MAQDIVSAVQAELLPQAERELNRRTTDNIEAYEYFLLARQSMQLASSENTWNPETEPLLQRAVELDPDYAQAWALLAISHGDRFWFGENRTNERLEAMKSALDRAMELQPDLPEAHLALATYHYRGFYDYPAALEELLRVKEQIPNDTILHFNLGLTLRRLGRYDEAIDAFERRYLETVLRRCNGRIEDTAKLAGIHSRSLYQKMRRLGIRKESFKLKK